MANFAKLSMVNLQDIFMPYLTEICTIEKPSGHGANATYSSVYYDIPVRREISDSALQADRSRGRDNRIIPWTAWIPKDVNGTKIHVTIGYRLKIGQEAYMYVDAAQGEDVFYPLIELYCTQNK